MNESKLEKVRKLLAKAEGAANEHEAEAFNAKANELIARHGIDQALLAERGEIKDEIVVREFAIDDPYSRIKGDMLASLGHAMRCEHVLYRGKGGTWKTISKVKLVGYQSDIERIEMVYTSLLMQATSQLVRLTSPYPEWESTTSYRRSWLLGFSQTAVVRVRQAEQQAQTTQGGQVTASGKSTDLVLVDRSAAVKNQFKEQFPKLVNVANPKSSGSGYGEGVQAGKRADIGAKRVGGTSKALR